jgi:hypothetical protein
MSKSKSALSFSSYEAALLWAKKYGNEHCHFHHYWKVQKASQEFVVAVISKNSGQIEGFASKA